MEVKEKSSLEGALYGKEIEVKHQAKVIGKPAFDVFASLFISNGTIILVPIQNESINATTNTSMQLNQTNETKLIIIKLDYNNGTLFDQDNDGMENITGVIDFTVTNTEFNWSINITNLCTRWDTFSIEELTSTIVCYGSEKCCNFVDLSKSRESWNETFYSYFGQYGATYNNTISAQVIYVDYNLSLDNLYADIVNSDWKSLKANFLNLSVNVVNSSNKTENNTDFPEVNNTNNKRKT